MKEVVSVFPSRTFQLQRTRSWDFIGLYEKIHQNATVESDVIIGVFDSGTWHESNEGFGPAPKKWKGACAGSKNFTCHNKIIGAPFYEPADSARDANGHGTHVASTAAGNTVKDVSYYGIAQGTATGGGAILAAFDDAIANGVGIITISIGPDKLISFNDDPLGIGTFHTMEKGILTTNHSGNDGPLGNTKSLTPWMLTVAASSTDCRIIDNVVLGNGSTLVGISLNPFTLNGTKFPLVYGNSHCSQSSAGNCSASCLDSD
ncbi:putative cucumisin [Rosa chinensis]|uniref:Putative cucumisin n=1 Tax=Rosa chinensis TaxID=74649 RepID=A0A2P6S9I0_ROSCH|nr:putative cucumisin [Rosa chinensis]